ncbi:hypothetical protein NEISICOT_01263 [Neisseria sicca ATCC 29256]|uniref:Uncharacterized protein n=1 Tax=Neisseria sicca ATCC 29256 TaxID=547045 RepID=C6M419_NEISI|nr:hypothetical protein NEISICOT_01263 [Neisseria sicca ATCC 29256]
MRQRRTGLKLIHYMCRFRCRAAKRSSENGNPFSDDPANITKSSLLQTNHSFRFSDDLFRVPPIRVLLKRTICLFKTTT